MSVFEDVVAVEHRHSGGMSLGMELLVRAVREGRQDPWDLDVTRLADHYLAMVEELDGGTLARFGSVLLCASILVRLKASVLAGRLREELAPPLEETDEPFDLEYDAGAEADCPENGRTSRTTTLSLVRRPDVERSRVITLVDLVEALERCEKREAVRRAARRRGASRDGYDPVSSAHEDDIGACVERARRIVASLRATCYLLTLEELEKRGMSRVDAYLALLFLASDGELVLSQDEFYGELYVEPSGGSDAVFEAVSASEGVEGDDEGAVA